MKTTTLRLLLIEDDSEDARLIMDALVLPGPYRFVVDWSPTLELGHRLLRDTRYDAVLTDLSLGPTRGLEVLFDLHKRHPDVPIVVLSDNDDAATAILALKSGAQDFLVKAHARRELVARSIAYAVERHRIESALRRQTDELRGFTYAVTHDIRTPLITIDFLIEEVKERLADGEDASSVEHLLDAVSGRVQSMEDLIQDIHALATAAEGDQDQRVNVSRVLEEIASDLAVLAGDRGVTFSVDLSDLPPVRGNHTQMRQLLGNLVGNAVKYTPHRGGRVSIRGHPLGTDGTSGWRIEVEDNGPGVPEEHRDRIFQVFERAPDPLGRQIPGTGIGLAIAAKVAHNLGSWIHVDDRPGGGARFWFDLAPSRLITTPAGTARADLADRAAETS